jgi:hypothetical protein
LVVFGWFLSTLISRPKKGSKSQGEKCEDFKKIFRKLEILNPKLETMPKLKYPNDPKGKGNRRLTLIYTGFDLPPRARLNNGGQARVI